MVKFTKQLLSIIDSHCDAGRPSSRIRRQFRLSPMDYAKVIRLLGRKDYTIRSINKIIEQRPAMKQIKTCQWFFDDPAEDDYPHEQCGALCRPRSVYCNRHHEIAHKHKLPTF